jgi:hypothetical protein
MYSLGDPLPERSEAALFGGDPEEAIACGIRQAPEPPDHDRGRASRTLLTRIRELHLAGRSAEEIAAEVLTTEPENVMFRAAVLIEIILHQLRLATEGKDR